jgi:hypothetical protein
VNIFRYKSNGIGITNMIIVDKIENNNRGKN